MNKHKIVLLSAIVLLSLTTGTSLSFADENKIVLPPAADQPVQPSDPAQPTPPSDPAQPTPPSDPPQTKHTPDPEKPTPPSDPAQPTPPSDPAQPTPPSDPPKKEENPSPNNPKSDSDKVEKKVEAPSVPSVAESPSEERETSKEIVRESAPQTSSTEKSANSDTSSQVSMLPITGVKENKGLILFGVFIAVILSCMRYKKKFEDVEN
ncbi:MAG: hypothetical protein Q4A90_06650 [Streptococcus sp.]|nr:hypothetical protein [Streptococcus sp.]